MPGPADSISLVEVAMPTAHCVSNTQGVILAVDQGFLDLVGRPEADVIGTSYRDLTHPEDLGISMKMLSSLVDRAAPMRLRKRYVRPDGSFVSALLLVTHFADPARLVSTLLWREGEEEAQPARLWEAALRIQHVHSVRRAAFGDDLATDPVGSLLIAVYLAEAEGRIVHVDQLASVTNLARSNVIRWLNALQQHGIIAAAVNSMDVQLTELGMLNMERTLKSVFDSPLEIDRLYPLSDR